MIANGMLITLIVEGVLAVGLWLMLNRMTHGQPVPKIHKIPGLNAIDEAIGRATELGRPIHATPGAGALSDAATFAGLNILHYVALNCAKYDTKMLTTARMTAVYPIATAVIRQSYIEAGKPDQFNENDIRFLSEDTWAWASGVGGLITREKVAASIMVGAFWAESLFVAEAGNSVHAIQVAGTASTAQLPFFVAACDYTLIGEEIFAASAYLSDDPKASASLIIQDYGKMVIIAVIVIGVLLSTANINFLTDILKL